MLIKRQYTGNALLQKSIFLCICLFLSVALFAAPASKKESDEAKKKLATTLKNLDVLILGAKTGLVRDIYSQVHPAMIDGRIRYAVDPKERPLLESIEVINTLKTSDVLVSISLFRADQKHPGLLSSFLLQAIALTRNSLVSETKPYRPDDIQKVYDTMDALYLQTRLLSDYAISAERTLHPFERYLIQSLANDENSGLAPMSGASMMLLGLDGQILASFSAHGGAAKEKIINAREYIDKIIAVSRRLSEALKVASTSKDKQSPELYYLAEVSALTMLRFGVALANDHLDRFYPGATTSEAKALEELNRNLDELELIARNNQKALMYQKQFLTSIGL